MTSPLSVEASGPSPAHLQTQIIEIQQTLVSFEAMVKENSSMIRSVMLKLESGIVPTSSPSQGSIMSSPSSKTDKLSASGRRKSITEVESSALSQQIEYPGYSKLVEELAKPMSAFRVSGARDLMIVLCAYQYTSDCIIVADTFHRRGRLPYDGSFSLFARDTSFSIGCSC